MTSSSNPSPSKDLDEGLDVRSTAFAFFVLALFAVLAGVVGFRLASFAVVFAGLPVSALFTVLGGEFVVAWPVEAVVWLTVAAWPGRHPAFGKQWWQTIGIIVLIALAFGLGMGTLVEPTTRFS